MDKDLVGRYFIKVGNCYVNWMFFHEVRMFSDYKKSRTYLTAKYASTEAKSRGIKNFKIVKKMY